MLEAFSYSIPVVPFGEAEAILRKHYTVIASSENAYWEIKSSLEHKYGLSEFVNFEYYRTFRKKVAVIYGNCHAYWIKNALMLSKEFNNIYGIYPLKMICNIELGRGA